MSKSIEEQIADKVVAAIAPEIQQMKATIAQLETKMNDAAGLTLMTQEEAEAYTGYGETQLWKFRKNRIIHNYNKDGKHIFYLKKELDALLQIKGRSKVA